MIYSIIELSPLKPSDYNNLELKIQVGVSSIEIKRKLVHQTNVFCSVLNQTHEIFVGHKVA